MPRTKKSKFTEEDERRVWDGFAKGLTPKQVHETTGITLGSVYNLIEKAVLKWGTPKPD